MVAPDLAELLFSISVKKCNALIKMFLESLLSVKANVNIQPIVTEERQFPPKIQTSPLYISQFAIAGSVQGN